MDIVELEDSAVVDKDNEMSHYDNEDIAEPVEPEPWVCIQRNTFTNWINVKLRELPGLEIRDLRSDFQDGVRLCRLMEVLTGRLMPGKVVVKPHPNAYEVGGNLGMALDAIRQDGIRLVNIGPEDISGGNLKLILGLVWLLIRHYQIGMGSQSSQLPSKSMMLSWVNAALRPHLTLTNFTTDWNSGKALLGLIEFCRPGTYTNWHSSTEHADDRTRCEHALKLAEKHLRVPLVISGEHLSSPQLDEQSTMTYLSYFMSVGSPGYKATLKWVQRQIAPIRVENFYTSWNSGHVALALARSLSGELPLSSEDLVSEEERCNHAIKISEELLGVPRIISGRDMANPGVDYLSIMAYAAWHRPEDQQVDLEETIASIDSSQVESSPSEIDLLNNNSLPVEEIVSISSQVTESSLPDSRSESHDQDVVDECDNYRKENITEVQEPVIQYNLNVNEEEKTQTTLDNAQKENTLPSVKQSNKYNDEMDRYLPIFFLLLAIIVLHIINRFVNE